VDDPGEPHEGRIFTEPEVADQDLKGAEAIAVGVFGSGRIKEWAFSCSATSSTRSAGTYRISRPSR